MLLNCEWTVVASTVETFNRCTVQVSHTQNCICFPYILLRYMIWSGVCPLYNCGEGSLRLSFPVYLLPIRNWDEDIERCRLLQAYLMEWAVSGWGVGKRVGAPTGSKAWGSQCSLSASSSVCPWRWGNWRLSLFQITRLCKFMIPGTNLSYWTDRNVRLSLSLYLHRLNDGKL